MKIVVRAFVLIAIGSVLFGCRAPKKETTQTAAKQKKEAPARGDKNPVAAPKSESAAPTVPGTKKESSMAAKVNGQTITNKDLDSAVNALLAQYGAQVPPDQMAGVKPFLKKQALESLIHQSLLVQEADREGLKSDNAAIDAQLKELVARFPSKEMFQQLLTTQGISEKQLRTDISQDLKIKMVIDKNVPKVKNVTPQEVDAFYRDNPTEFKSPERVRASHILITVKDGESDQDRAQKRLKLAKLKGEIEKGVDFSKLASENSECPSKAQGGDLGFFDRGKMVKPFEDAVFAMKEGQVSDVVETPFGYHLIKMTGKEEAKTIPLEQVRDKIATFLNQQNKQKLVDEYLQKLRSTVKIEYADGPRA